MFNKKLVLLYVSIYVSYNSAMEVKSSQDCSSRVNIKQPKSLQKSCLRPLARFLIHNYCRKSEDVSLSLESLKGLQILEIHDQQIAAEMLSLSDCTLNLLPDKLLETREIATDNVWCAQFHSTKNLLAFTHKGEECVIRILGFSTDDSIDMSEMHNESFFTELMLNVYKAQFKFICSFAVKEICFDKQGNYLMAALENTEKKLWNLSSRKELDEDAVLKLSPVFSIDDREKNYDQKAESHINQFIHNNYVQVFQFQSPNKINFVYENKLIKLKIRNSKLDALLSNCSIETAVKLIYLAQYKEHKRCLSCKKIELPKEISELLLRKSVIAMQCNFCKKKSTWRKLFNKKKT